MVQCVFKSIAKPAVHCEFCYLIVYIKPLPWFRVQCQAGHHREEGSSNYIMSRKSSSKTSPASSSHRPRRPKPTLPPRFQPDTHGSLDDRFSRAGRPSALSEDLAMGDLLEALPEVESVTCPTTDSESNIPDVVSSTEENRYSHYQVSHPQTYLFDTPTGHQQVPVETYAVAPMPALTSEPVAIVAPKVVRTQPDPGTKIPFSCIM